MAWNAIKRFIALVIAIVILAAIAGWAGSSIARNSDWEEPSNGIPIMLATNGVHTELVLPIDHNGKDWRIVFPGAGDPIKGKSPTHIAIGFGERDVFLNTPTFYDMKLSTALNVATSGGAGMIRIIPLRNPKTSANRRAFTVSDDQYAKLAAALEADLAPVSTGEPRMFETSSYDRGRYYLSLQRYTLINTCNQWTSDRLAMAGVRTGWFTPFSGGVMKWVAEPD